MRLCTSNSVLSQISWSDNLLDIVSFDLEGWYRTTAMSLIILSLSSFFTPNKVCAIFTWGRLHHMLYIWGWSLLLLLGLVVPWSILTKPYHPSHSTTSLIMKWAPTPVASLKLNERELRKNQVHKNEVLGMLVKFNSSSYFKDHSVITRKHWHTSAYSNFAACVGYCAPVTSSVDCEE
jgi:hypothetical protein